MSSQMPPEAKQQLKLVRQSLLEMKRELAAMGEIQDEMRRILDRRAALVDLMEQQQRPRLFGFIR